MSFFYEKHLKYRDYSVFQIAYRNQVSQCLDVLLCNLLFYFPYKACFYFTFRYHFTIFTPPPLEINLFPQIFGIPPFGEKSLMNDMDLIFFLNFFFTVSVIVRRNGNETRRNVSQTYRTPQYHLVTCWWTAMRGKSLWKNWKNVSVVAIVIESLLIFFQFSLLQIAPKDNCPYYRAVRYIPCPFF